MSETSPAAANATVAPPSGSPPLQKSMTEYQIRILAVIYTFEALSIFFVTFRIWCRVRYLKRLLWTDIFLILALALQITVQALNIVEICKLLEAYKDQHYPELVSLSAAFVQYAAFWCLRISVGLLFLEIFPGKKSKIIVYTAFLVVTATSFGPIFWMGSCSWPLVPQSLELVFNTCITAGFSGMVMHTAAGLLFDIGAVVLPMIPVWSLNMSTGKKLSLTFILALGLLTVACSAIRFSLAIKSLTGGPLTPGMQTNFTIFAATEMHVGLIAASLLTTWRVIQSRFLPKSVATYFSAYSSDSKSQTKDKHSRSASKGRHTMGETTGQDTNTMELESRNGDESGLLGRQHGGITVHTGFSVTTSTRYDNEDKEKGETVDVEVRGGSEGRKSF